MDYMTPREPQLNKVIEKISAVIKKVELDMLLIAKLNYTSHKMLWSEALHMCERVRNSMATTGSMKSPFEKLDG